jgi:Flp pilus assembly protein TadG
MPRPIKQFWHDQRGAVAVTYALALTALVGIAGVGYDYSRMMAMDTELQSAADEAALAAASQLDGRAGARANAQKAVQDYFGSTTADVANRTVMSNDGNGSVIKASTMTFKFYKTFDAATDTYGDEATTDAEATVVRVTVGARKAFFAFTPIVGAFNSGDMQASAAASLQGGTCKLPPLLICGPSNNPDFPTTADIGKGLLLKLGPLDDTALPGIFGYTKYPGGNGANTVKDLLGSNSAADLCNSATAITPQSGNINNATDYLNTRFDIYTNPLVPSDCAANGDKCPARSTRKDLVIKEVYTYSKVVGPPIGTPQTYPTTLPARPACGAAAPTGATRTADTDWSLVPAASVPANQVIGFPRDSGISVGTIGNGVWDVTAYYNAHPAVPAGYTHRWDIYKWERDNPGQGLLPSIANTSDTVSWAGPFKASGNGNAACGKNDATCGYVPTWTNYCSYPSPIKGTYHATAKDRRVLTVAVGNCSAVKNGSGDVPINKWMDVFLTEPSWNRSTPVTSNSEIYGEIIGPATKPDGGNAFQYYGRQRAVLLQ